MDLTAITEGKRIKAVNWPADNDNGGYFASTLEFYKVGDETWVVGTTDNDTTECARLLDEPKFTGLVPGVKVNALGAGDSGCFDDLIEDVAGVRCDLSTYTSD